MVISSTEAAEALRDIAQTDRRTRVSGAYHVASPHLILWGLIWAAGYAGSGLTSPEQWGLVWLPLILVGVVGAVGSGVASVLAFVFAFAVFAFLFAAVFVFEFVFGKGIRLFNPPSRAMPTNATFAESGDQTIISGKSTTIVSGETRRRNFPSAEYISSRYVKSGSLSRL